VTDVYKYGNEPWGCIKKNFCRLLERLKFLCHGIIFKAFIYIASIDQSAGQKSYKPFGRTLYTEYFLSDSL
jgi:hypothetical protein